MEAAAQSPLSSSLAFGIGGLVASKIVLFVELVSGEPGVLDGDLDLPQGLWAESCLQFSDKCCSFGLKLLPFVPLSPQSLDLCNKVTQQPYR
jgi:hypothetical protein